MSSRGRSRWRARAGGRAWGRSALALVLLAGAALAVSCGRGGSDAATGELVLHCGAGLRPPVEELLAEFTRVSGRTVATNYTGSERLVSAIRLSRRGDVVLPGDGSYVDQLQADGLVASRRVVCYLAPVILVERGNPLRIGGLHDLLRPEVRLGLGDEAACAIGTQSRKVFQKNGIAWDRVQRQVKFKAATVGALADHVRMKSLDAAIVWDAVAAAHAEYAQCLPIPPEHNEFSTVEVAALRCSRQAAAAEQLAGFLASDAARQVFSRHGYRVAPPPSRPKE